MTEAHPHRSVVRFARPPRSMRRVSSFGALALLGIVLAALAGCGAAAGGWRLIGPESGAHVYSIVADSHVAGLIYAGGDDGGVYRVRADQTSGHVLAGDGIPQGDAVASVLPDPQRAGVVLAGTVNGLYRSDTYGDHWRAYSSGLPHDKTVLALAAAPDDSIVLAGVDHAGVYRSSDDGATWSAASDGLPAQATPVALAWDAPDHLWLLGLNDASGPALYASADGAQTWAPRAGGLPAGAQVNALAMLGSAAPALFAATSLGLFTSANAGQQWSRVAAGLPQRAALALATLPQQPTWVYVALGGAVYRSTDGGAHWQSVTSPLSANVQGLVATEGAKTGPVVYAAAGQVARYPTGSGGGNPISADLLIAVFVAALLAGFIFFWRRRISYGRTQGLQRSEANTGRTAETAERWGSSRGSGGSGMSAPSGQPPRSVDEHADAGRVLAPSDMTARSATGEPANESTSQQNGQGQPEQRR
ncbi:MAG TPA: YCF48-related protein [Ktedonobacterales bacterium]